jgi:hypothetical protein
MCNNDNCQSGTPIKIQDHQIDNQMMNTTAILHMHELSHYEEQFRLHPELSVEVDDQLIDALFESKELCWECARPAIEEAMHWKFYLLHQGISLDKHERVLEFLNDFQPLDDDWNVLLAWVLLEEKIEISYGDDTLREMIINFQAQGVAAENVQSMAEWLYSKFRRAITTEELTHCVNAGFVNSDDLDLLSHVNLKWDIENLNPLPSKDVLMELEIDGRQYHEFEQVFVSLFDWGCYATESEIAALVKTGISFDQLAVFIEEPLADVDEDGKEDADPSRDELMDGIFDQLDLDYCNREGISVFTLFSRTVKSIVNVGLTLSFKNLATYWGLSESLILYVIDNGLVTDDVLKIAQLVKTPSELVGWLERDDDAIEADEIHEWVLARFDAEDATRWKREGFNAEIAQQWRAVIDDPVVAQRRISAGIQIGEKE